MKRHVDDELKRLKEKILRMGLLVEKALSDATTALFERDTELAQEVMRHDQEINLCEIEIDELGHELIARYQPAANDLRFITMVLKITNDLERMADQAVNISEQVIRLNEYAPFKPYPDFPRMAQVAKQMVRDAIDSFMDEDVEKASRILEKDDVIDTINAATYDDVQKILEENSKMTRTGVSLILISHNLERVADLATNIAEDVIYLKKGIDVRHHIRERREGES